MNCIKCGIKLNDSNWLISNKRKKHYICSKCTIIKTRDWKKANPEEHKAQQRRYREKHHDDFRNWRFLERYNISLEDYKQILKSQNGSCAICGSKVNGNRMTHLAVDHDHETGKARGILCDECNIGLGRFHDSPILLQKALDYLRKWFGLG